MHHALGRHDAWVLASASKHHADHAGLIHISRKVDMMHECRPGESTRKCYIQSSCRPYGVDTVIKKGQHAK